MAGWLQQQQQWRVRAAPSSSSSSCSSCSCCCCLRFPFPPSIRFRPPSTWHLCLDGLPISNIEMIRSCFVISKICPPFLLHSFCFCFLYVSYHSIPYLHRTPQFQTLSPLNAPGASYLFLPAVACIYECHVRSTNLSRGFHSVLTIVINKQIILVNNCLLQMMMMGAISLTCNTGLR